MKVKAVSRKCCHGVVTIGGLVLSQSTPIFPFMKLTMTYELAHAAGIDAGNRSMRKAGRKHWNEDDYNVCVAESDRLWPGDINGLWPKGAQ